MSSKAILSQLLASGATKSALAIYSHAKNTPDDSGIDDWGDLSGDGFRASQAIHMIILAGGWDVEEVTYDVNSSTIRGTTPEIIATTTVENDTGTAQSSTVNLSKSVTETSSFTFMTGFSLTVGTSFEAGIPLVVDGKVSVQGTATTQFTWGKSKSITTTVGEMVKVDTPPYSKIQATASMKSSNIDIPCRMKLRSQVDHTVTAHSDVTYHGLSYWDFEVQYETL
jgi:hypothetical protein